MHLLTALVAIGAATGDIHAQVRRAASAVAGADTGTIAYDIDGIRVIHRHLGTGDIVVANLYLLGGVRQVTAANAGIELLLLEASERGTKSYSRDRLRRSMAQLGTKITTQVGVDWSSIGVQATRATLDSTWSILASRVMEPRVRLQPRLASSSGSSSLESGSDRICQMPSSISWPTRSRSRATRTNCSRQGQSRPSPASPCRTCSVTRKRR